MTLHPVILAGGSGTRLWPLSREACPKQFQPLAGERSPFQETLARLRELGRIQPATVVVGAEHRFIVAEQAKAVGEPLRTTWLEPAGRSTAPALTLVALELARQDPEALMLVLSADHDIPDGSAFAEAVAQGEAAAAQGHLVVFGVEPRGPETGYGYIERGADLPTAPGCHRVASFVEKPEREIAQHFIESGRHEWNSGIFLFGARAWLAELERFEPELAQACRAAEAATPGSGPERPIPRAAFAACKSISIDHAVLEHTREAAVVRARFRWSDLGSWDSLWERAARDADGNAISGDVQAHDLENCYVRGDGGRLVVGLGLEDTVIVDTPDALLVARRGDTQRVREAVEMLKARGRGERLVHREVRRPWGSYRDIDAGERFRVKRITVAPGGKLSLQYHHHRAEHWIVVSGTAKVTRGEEVRLMGENQSIFIELGQVHRLENPGRLPLVLIEVQAGAYLGEDDIVRVEDIYQRVEGAPDGH